eukprot:PRCOL_00003226-RA
MAPVITPTVVEATPNECALDAPLTLRVAFTTDEDIAAGRWEVRYMVDMTGRRHIVEVGKSDGATAYAAGTPHEFTISVPTIELTGVKKSWLQNAGLLLACLIDDASGDEIVQISAVVQVVKKGDVYERTIMSPLE